MENVAIMNDQKLQPASLRKLLGKYFILSFLLFFIASIVGSIIHDVLTNSLFEYEDIPYDFLFALITSGLLILFLWDRFKDVFILLNNDKIEVPHHLTSSKSIRPYKLLQIDDLASKLEKSGMLITYLDRNKYIIKIRQKLIFFDGCGGILHFDNKKEALTMISFSFGASSSKKRINNFNKKIYKLIEIQGNNAS